MITKLSQTFSERSSAENAHKAKADKEACMEKSPSQKYHTSPVKANSLLTMEAPLSPPPSIQRIIRKPILWLANEFKFILFPSRMAVFRFDEMDKNN